MGSLILQWLLLAGLILTISSAYAQSSPKDRTSPPISKSPVKITLPYLSVFSHYISYKEQSVLPWQELNDKAGEIGGWRFYAREGKQPDKEGKSLEPKPAETDHPSIPGKNSDRHHGHGSKP
jgi:hypothetical protein